MALAPCLDPGLAEPELPAEGDGGLAREADHAQAVGAVGRDLEFDDVVVETEQPADVLSGRFILRQDEDAVGNTVRELFALRVQILGRADVLFFRVEGDELAHMEIRTGCEDLPLLSSEGEDAAPRAVFLCKRLDPGRADLAEDPVARLDIGADRGLCGVDRVIVAQDRRGDDEGLGEVVRGHAQLPERAEHALGGDAAQLAAADLGAVGEQRAVERGGDELALVHVPGARADLHGLAAADVQLCDEHVVGVRVLFKLHDTADDDPADRLREVARDLHLRAGDAHRLGEGVVVHLLDRQIDEFIEPFS